MSEVPARFTDHCPKVGPWSMTTVFKIAINWIAGWSNLVLLGLFSQWYNGFWKISFNCIK
jgi:hypothetical protein